MCIVEGCSEEKTVAKEMCWKHYRRHLRHGSASTIMNGRGKSETCGTAGCGRKSYAKGLCHLCYNKAKYNARVAQGLCGGCGEVNDRSETTCSACLVKRRVYKQAKREKAKESKQHV